MILFDLNVLVYAHREDCRDHAVCRDFFERFLNGGAAYGYSERVLSGFSASRCAIKNSLMRADRPREPIRL